MLTSVTAGSDRSDGGGPYGLALFHTWMRNGREMQLVYFRADRKVPALCRVRSESSGVFLRSSSCSVRSSISYCLINTVRIFI